MLDPLLGIQHHDRVAAEVDGHIDGGERERRDHPRVAQEQHRAVEVAAAAPSLLAGIGANLSRSRGAVLS